MIKRFTITSLRSHLILVVLFSFFGIVLAGCNGSDDGVSEPVSGPSVKQSQAAVASAHPLATEAGLEILRQGGNAFDAAIAVTATLAVVEPYSSGIGGGGFYLFEEAGSGRYQMLDARETAPSAADKDMYLDESGEIVAGASIDGALAAGIPGIPAALVHLAENHGKLKLSASLKPAISYAKNGFPVDSHYQRMAGFRLQALRDNEAAGGIFLEEGDVPSLGYLVIQEDLGNTLKLIADEGLEGFYHGELAKQMVDDVRRHGGIWSLQDLAQYKVVMREPVVTQYRDMKLVTAALPSSGGIVLTQILGMLEHFDISSMDQVQRIHHIAEAMRRSYRDRAEYMGDTDFVDVPVERLVSDVYIDTLAESFSDKKATPSASLDAFAAPSGKGADTTHFSVIDADGNKVSATLSINYPFGACFVAAGTGVLLNDEMDDFSSKPGVPNVYGLVGSSANAIEPGKRMLSSMTPSIAETSDKVAIIGTPGGSRIITMVLLGLLDFYEQKDADTIVNHGRFHHQYLPDEISFEPGVLDDTVVTGLRALGHATREMESDYGNMQLIILDKKSGQIDAASDGRGIGTSGIVD